MPKVLLTAEQRKQNVMERRNMSLKGLIQHKMTEYNISKETLANSLCIAEHTLWYRLQAPADRLNFNEMAIIIGVLRISNDEVYEILRKGA